MHGDRDPVCLWGGQDLRVKCLQLVFLLCWATEVITCVSQCGNIWEHSLRPGVSKLSGKGQTVNLPDMAIQLGCGHARAARDGA